ncbi:MAG: acyltransferase [Lachnospiraceae bacterium]|nr:acyltransferase [Lachnospiraceae bacterium]
MKRDRNSNLEILRILAMFMIIGHHLALYSSFSFENELTNINQYYVLFLEMGGKIGSNIFFLITGYFMVSRKEFNKLKLVQFIVQVFLYSITISTIFIGSGLIEYADKLVLHALFPLTYSTWWFATAYIVLYLLSPFINVLIENLSKEQYKKLIVLTTVLFSIIPTIFNQTFQCNALVWSIYLYFLGGYIKIHLSKKINLKYAIPILIGSILSTYLLTIILMKTSIHIELYGLSRKQLFEMQTIPVLVISVLFLIIFLNIPPKKNKIVNYVASSTFAVYLIHEHPYVRNYLYTHVFDNLKFAESSKLVPYTLIEILCIFTLGILIESIRKIIFDSLIQFIFNKVKNNKI